MAESMSGQDEVNPAFWLATQASKMGPSFPLGISHFSSVRKRSIPACKESSVDSPELVDFAIGLENSVFNLPDG